MHGRSAMRTICVYASLFFQAWAGEADPKWCALTGTVGSRQQGSLAKAAPCQPRTSGAPDPNAEEPPKPKPLEAKGLAEAAPVLGQAADADGEHASPPSASSSEEPLHGREMPSNFDPRCLPAWQSLPAELLPTEPCKGRLSFTAHSPCGAVVEVQLKSRAFMYKKTRGGKPWAKHAPGSPAAHAWSHHRSVLDAWRACKAALSWDDRA